MESKRRRWSSTQFLWCSLLSPPPEPEPRKTLALTCSRAPRLRPRFLACFGGISAFSLRSSLSRPWHWRSVRTCPIGGTPTEGHRLKLPYPYCASASDMLRCSPTGVFSTAHTGSSPRKQFDELHQLPGIAKVIVLARQNCVVPNAIASGQELPLFASRRTSGSCAMQAELFAVLQRRWRTP
jgi:hypothetical protein